MQDSKCITRTFHVISLLSLIGACVTNVIFSRNVHRPQLDLLITPPSFAFSIWGPIYTSTFIWVFYEIFTICFLTEGSDRLTNVLLWFSCAFNAAWIIMVGSSSLIWQFLIMMAYLVISQAMSLLVHLRSTNYLIRFSVAVHAAWIICAATLSLFVWVKDALYTNIPSSEADTLLNTWYIAALVFITLMETSMALVTKDFMYILVGAWMLGTLLFKLTATDTFDTVGIKLAIMMCLSFSAIVLVVTIALFVSQVKEIKVMAIEARDYCKQISRKVATIRTPILVEEKSAGPEIESLIEYAQLSSGSLLE